MQEQDFCVVFTQDLRMPHLHATQGETSKNKNASARNLMLCVCISNSSNYNATLQERFNKSRLQLHSTTSYGLTSYTLKVNNTTVTKCITISKDVKCTAKCSAHLYKMCHYRRSTVLSSSIELSRRRRSLQQLQTTATAFVRQKQ